MSETNRRSFLLGALGAGALAAGAGPSAPAKGPAGSTRIDALIARERASIRETMAKGGVEGVAVCFIHEGAPVWIEGFGVTDKSSNHPVGTDTLFSIQSTSKNFTAAAIMIAVQHGLLDLDEPITTYLPQFSVHSRFEPAPEAKMTLRLLLSHRAGFTHETPVGNNYDAAFPDFETHVRSISQTWLRYPVGERYRYSNLGFDLAGYILQVRSGMPFAQYVQANLFGPLGTADATFAPAVYEARENRALGHDTGHETVPLRSPLIPSGGLYISAQDMSTYALFHLHRGSAAGRVVLREDLWHEMHGFALGGDYGLGVIRTELRYGDTPVRLLNHKGGGFGFGSVFDYCPETGLGWAAMFNRPASGTYRFGAGLIDGALRLRYGEHRPRLTIEELGPIEPTPAQLRQFVGTWVARNESVELRIQDGVLQMREDEAVTPLHFGSPTDVWRVGDDGEVRTYRYFAAQGSEPAHLECSEAEVSLDYNYGPKDPAGPDHPNWAAFVGQYRIRQWGTPVQTVAVGKRNGWLYLNDLRLIIETEPGLLFTCDGEAVDFRCPIPTWKNVHLERIT